MRATVKVDDTVAVTALTTCSKLAPEPFTYVGFVAGTIGDARYDDVLFEGN